MKQPRIIQMLYLIIIFASILATYFLWHLIILYSFKTQGVEVTGRIESIIIQSRPRSARKDSDYYALVEYKVDGKSYLTDKIYIETSTTDVTENYIGKSFSVTYLKDKPSKSIPTTTSWELLTTVTLFVTSVACIEIPVALLMKEKRINNHNVTNEISRNK
ncbi:DUF3592 domain-containing protein [Candidatus Dojkabacteria bacterium]|nr:DUF3592 domain-containing protein [Candidatus Dojkabacteria bacterium]